MQTRKRYQRGYILQIILILIVVGASAYAAIPLQEFVRERMAQLKAELVTRIEATAERDISYDSISPSIFRYVEIRNLRIHGRAREPDTLLTVRRLKVYYSLWRAVTRGPAHALTEVSVENTRLQLDAARDADLLRYLGSFAARTGAEPPGEMRVRGRNLAVSYSADTGTFAANGLSFELNIGSDRIGIEGRGDLTMDTPGLPVTGSTARVEVNGTFRSAANQARALLTLSGLSTPQFSVSEQSLQLVYDGESVELQKVKDDAPIDMNATYEIASGDASLSFLADGLRPGALVTFRGPLEVFAPWLQGTVSGDGRLRYDAETGAISYDAALSGRVSHPALLQELQGSFRMEGDSGQARISELRLESAGGAAVFSGTLDFARLMPEGELTLRRFVYGDIQPVSGAITIQRNGDSLIARAPRLSYGDLPLFGLDGTVYATEDGFSVQGKVALNRKGTRRVKLSGLVGLEPELSGRGTVTLDRVPAGLVTQLELAELSDLQSLPLGLDEADVSTRVSFEATAAGFSASVPYFLLEGSEPGLKRLSLTADYRADRLGLRNVVAHVGDEVIRGRVDLIRQSRGTIGFSSTAENNGMRYEVNGRYVDGRALVFSGSYGLEGRVYLVQDDRITVRAAVQNAPVPPAGPEARLSANASGVYRRDDDWSISISELSLSDVQVSESIRAELSAAAEIGPDGIEVSALQYSDGVSTLSGGGRISLTEGEETSAAGSVQLSSAETEEQYRFSGSFSGDSLEASASFTSSPLRRLGLAPVRGNVDGALQVRRSGEELTYRLQFDAARAFFNNDRFDVTGSMTLQDQTVSVESLELQYLTHRLSRVSGSFDLGEGLLNVSAQYENTRPASETELRAAVQADFNTSESSLDLADVSSTPFEAMLNVEGVRLDGEEQPPWEFTLSRTEDLLTIDGAPSDSVHGTMENSGEFELSLSRPLPIRFQSRGTLREGQIETNLTRVEVDVAALPALFDFGDIRVVDGTIEGSMRIVGPVNDPDFYGTLVSENTQGKLIYVPEIIGPTRVFLVFQEKVLRINKFEAPVGEGIATVQGEVVLNRWAADQSRFTIRASGEKGVHVAHNFEGAIIDGYGTGTVEVDSSPGTVSVNGRIQAGDTSITLGESPAPLEGRVPQVESQVDFTFRTRSRVEFLWPTSEFPIIRAISEAGETVRLQSSTADASFSLTGDVGIQGGEIFYFDRSFYIREGQIVFAEDEEGFDPRISVRAEIREVSSEGPVRISLRADNTRLSQFSPRFESNPPLSDAEIAAILGQNIFDASGDGGPSLSSAVRLPSDVAVQFGLINSFEDRVRDALNLDLFSVRTHVFQNLVLGAIDGTDYPLDNRPPSLGKYLDNTTVFMGKYLGSDLFLELLFELRSKNPLSSDIQSLGGLEVDSELSMEWQTPFFQLQWNFFPRNPQSLFLTDNTFEFSWEFSY